MRDARVEPLLWLSAAPGSVQKCVTFDLIGTRFSKVFVQAPGKGVVLAHGGGARSRWRDHIASLLTRSRRAAIGLSVHGDGGHLAGSWLCGWAKEIMAAAETAGLAPRHDLTGHSNRGGAAFWGTGYPSPEPAVIVLTDSVVGMRPRGPPPSIPAGRHIRTYPHQDGLAGGRPNIARHSTLRSAADGHTSSIRSYLAATTWTEYSIEMAMGGPMTTLCILVGANGSLSPVEVKIAAGDEVQCVLLLDRAEAEAYPSLRQVATAVAPTVIVDTSDVSQVCGHVVDHGAAAIATFVDAYCPLVDNVNARVFGRAKVPGKLNRWHKGMQRELLKKAGVSTIANSVATTWPEVEHALSKHGLPAVVKPAHGTSSRDLWLLRDQSDLRGFRVEADALVHGPVVVEPFIAEPTGFERAAHRANYLSAELFVTSAGTVGFLTERPPLAAPCRETGIIGPSTVDEVCRNALLYQASEALAALSVGPGCYNIEIKLTDGMPEVIEVNGRLGGYVRRLVQLGAGVDIAPAAVQAALGRHYPFQLVWSSFVAAIFFHSPVDAAIIAAVPQYQDIARLPGVVAVDYIAAPGTKTSWRSGTNAAAARVWLSAANDIELGDLMAECAGWLTENFDFRDITGQRIRDERWLAQLTNRSQRASHPTEWPGQQFPGVNRT